MKGNTMSNVEPLFKDKHMIICQGWETVEGQVPDGFTLHSDKEDRDDFVSKYLLNQHYSHLYFQLLPPDFIYPLFGL